MWNEPSSPRNRPGRRPQRHLHGRPAGRGRDGARRRLVVPRAARDPVRRRRGCPRRRAGAPREHRHLERPRRAVPRLERGGAGEFSFSSRNLANDTISVKVTRAADGVFAKIFGIDSVKVHAKASARSGNPNAARYAAPIAVDKAHPLLNCHPLPCFNQATTLDLQKTGPGAFRLLNLDLSHGGTGGKVDYEWIVNGYDGYMPLNWYGSDPGAAFNDKKFKDAMNQRSRGRAALSRLRRGSGQRRQLRVPRDRLGRLPRHRLHGEGQQGNRGRSFRSRSSGRESSRSPAVGRRTSEFAPSSSSNNNPRKRKKRDAHDVQG